MPLSNIAHLKQAQISQGQIRLQAQQSQAQKSQATQKATQKATAALDKTRQESQNRVPTTSRFAESVQNRERKFWTESTMFQGSKVFQRNDQITGELEQMIFREEL